MSVSTHQNTEGSTRLSELKAWLETPEAADELREVIRKSNETTYALDKQRTVPRSALREPMTI
jgi:hypothetical protein